MKGTEGLICRPDPLLWEVRCLPGAWGKDGKGKQETFLTLVWPSGYYPLLTFQVGMDEVATRSLRAI